MPDTEYFWLVDPIDGTSNYAFGLDYNAVNIALQHREDDAAGRHLGIMSVPITVAAGKALFRREASGVETRLQVNNVPELRRALITTASPITAALLVDNNAAEFARILQLAGGVRCLGSAALDLAHVASGAVCAFWKVGEPLGRRPRCALRARSRLRVDRLRRAGFTFAAPPSSPATGSWVSTTPCSKPLPRRAPGWRGHLDTSHDHRRRVCPSVRSLSRPGATACSPAPGAGSRPAPRGVCSWANGVVLMWTQLATCFCSPAPARSGLLSRRSPGGRTRSTGWSRGIAAC